MLSGANTGLSEPAGGSSLAIMAIMLLEVVLGRGLACCWHPRAAWRVLSPSRRLLLALAYGAAGYIVTLASLLLLG